MNKRTLLADRFIRSWCRGAGGLRAYGRVLLIGTTVRFFEVAFVMGFDLMSYSRRENSNTIVVVNCWGVASDG